MCNLSKSHFVILTLSLCMAVSVSSYTTTLLTNNNNNRKQPKIINGESGSLSDVPWLVSIRTSTFQRHLCGGILVSNRHVITAAHCFLSVKNVVIRVLQPTAGNSQKRIDFKVKKINSHPQYSRITHENDIAVLELVSNVTIDKRVQPAQLPSSQPTAGQNVIAWGWGSQLKNPDGKEYSLAKVTLPLVDNGNCQKAFRRRIITGQLCAGGGNKDTCVGDSGGPLAISGNVVVGLTSYGHSTCATIGKPGVYTNVFSYVSWIRKFIGTTSSSTTGSTVISDKGKDKNTLPSNIWDIIASTNPA